MSKEIWKPITEFNGLYEISSIGRVRSIDRQALYRKSIPGSIRLIKGKVLKPNINKGYHLYTLTLNGKPFYRYSHRLVITYFIGEIPKNKAVNHKDANKSNNSVKNLEICTNAENNKHAGLMNLKPIGTNHTNSKLTHEQLKEVRRLLNETELSHKKIAKMFNVYRTTISRIANKKSYSKEIT